MNELELVLFSRFSNKKSNIFTSSIKFSDGFYSTFHIDNFCNDTILQLFGGSMMNEYINYKKTITLINNEFCNKLNLKFSELKKERCNND